jgi:multiple antibiotic resistance protein
MDPLAGLKAVLLLFAIVNPVGSIPIFVQLTEGMTPKQRERAFRTAILSAAAILILFIVAGKLVLEYVFQIGINDLKAAGGLLLVIIAIDHLLFGSLVRGVLQGGDREAHRIGAVPIACPILAGPGAMMTVLVITSQHGAWGYLTATVAVLVVLATTWLIFRFLDVLYRFLGEIVCTVLSKVFCLFIAAIGIRMMMEGIQHYFQ